MMWPSVGLRGIAAGVSLVLYVMIQLQTDKVLPHAAPDDMGDLKRAGEHATAASLYTYGVSVPRLSELTSSADRQRSH